MASTALLGFLKGNSDEYLDHVKNREKAEAELRKMKRAAEINHEYFKQEREFLENLPSAREERARKRAKEQRDVESHTIGMESDRLSLDKTRQDMALDRQQSARADRIADAQIRSYNRSGTGRSGGKGSLDASTLDSRIGIVNAITSRLEDMGLDTNEVLAARNNMLQAAREGKGLEWFTDFEQRFLQEMRPVIKTRDNDARMERIRKSLDGAL